MCSRVGIMAAGRLRAIGSVQHLKHTHGQGCAAAATCCDSARGWATVGSCSCRSSCWLMLCCAVLCCRYSLEMRVAPGCTAAAEQLVAACCPAAHRRPQHWQADMPARGAEAGGGADVADVGSAHLNFSIPQHQANLPALFAALERGRCVRSGLRHLFGGFAS